MNMLEMANYAELQTSYESDYAFPVTHSANLAAAPVDTQAKYPTDLWYYFCELDTRAGVQPDRNVYSHESAPRTMNPMALQVEAVILEQPSPWEWIPDQPTGRRGQKAPVFSQAPIIDPYTSEMLPTPRKGFSGIYPFSYHTEIPFPNAWE